MALSSDLISQFVKISNDDPKPKTEATVYGTVVMQDDSIHVKLDGSDRTTPANSTADVKDGDRVTVMIKNHTAIITGNMDDPSASSKAVREQGVKISEFDVIIATRVSTEELNAEKARIDSLVADNVLIREKLTANEGYISDLTTDVLTVNETLKAHEGIFETIETTKLSADVADLKFATIENLDATNADIYNLQSTYGEFEKLTTNRLAAAEAFIDSADVKYMNLDFANVDEAVIQNFYAKFGMMESVTIKDGVVTGKLTGVEINADLITSGTLKTDRLIVKGQNGLYYALNVNAHGESVNVTEVPTDGIDGRVLVAKSVVADKVDVSDLSAFGATIGKFNLTNNALYSGVKSSVTNTTAGVYMDAEGQFAIGDTANRIEYYKIGDEFQLSVIVGDKDVQTTLRLLENSIVTVVEEDDGNGGTRLVQKGNGWEFNIGDIQNSIGAHEERINGLDTNVDGLNRQIAYVRVDETDENNPILTLGSTKSDFAVTITNEQISFMDGGDTPAYINNSKLMIENAEVKSELQFGQFVWSKRKNGNMGVTWVDSEEVSG